MISKSRQLALAHRIPASRANGPGERAVIWVQGCTLNCPGCFNPETHPFGAGEILSVSSLLEWLKDLPPSLEGLTISGGEPLQQAPALAEFLLGVRETTQLSVLLFTGYEWNEIQPIRGIKEILDCIDVLISGRYQDNRRLAAGLAGSSNKTIHYLTTRYTPADLEVVPEAEIWIEPDGRILFSGIDPVKWRN